MWTIPTELIKREKDLIKIGEVSSVDCAKATARVVFDDDDSLVSFDLPVLQRNTLRNSDYWMPDVGEDVLCLFLGSGEEEGFILGSFYAGSVTPPESQQNKRTTVFADGTIITYDRDTHELMAKIEGTSIVANRSSVSVKAPDTINVEATIINVNGSSSVNVSGGSTVNVDGGAAINLSAPAITLAMGGSTMKLNGSSCAIDTAEMRVTGNVTVDGDVIAGGISLQGHTHTAPHGETSTPH